MFLFIQTVNIWGKRSIMADKNAKSRKKGHKSD